MNTYKKFCKIAREGYLLNSAQTLLEWDQETYMPEKGIEIRSETLEILSGYVHKAKTSKKYAKALSTLISIETGEILDPSLQPEERASLQAFRKDYLIATKLPASFVKKSAEVISKATHVWKEAKQKGNFNLFAPHLEKVIALARQKATYLGFSDHPYDALLDLYEPGATVATLSPLFHRLQGQLTTIVEKIQQQSPIDDAFLFASCNAQAQLELASTILQSMGLSPLSSRLDLAEHPFCQGISPSDVRMTTAIKPSNFLFCLFSVLHEAGHALYDLGLPPQHFGTPLGEAISLGIHESQSRFWETRIGQSLGFWKYCVPHIHKIMPGAFDQYDAHDFYQAINRVQPSLIRIEADEVTYNLHIILRFEIEKALLEGTLSVKDLPEVWNTKMQHYLKITPPSIQQGCLQDIHWSCGLIGYFPTYTLGNLFASQFFEAFEKEHPDWEDKLAGGSFLFIRSWLQQKIHVHGRRYDAQTLCKNITGQELSITPFIHYLQKKYLK